MDSPDAPRAISENQFRKLCPNATILLKEELAERLNGATVSQKLDIWVEKLSSMEDRCIEIPQETPQVFDYMYVPPTLNEILINLSSLIRLGFSEQRKYSTYGQRYPGRQLSKTLAGHL